MSGSATLPVLVSAMGAILNAEIAKLSNIPASVMSPLDETARQELVGNELASSMVREWTGEGSQVVTAAVGTIMADENARQLLIARLSATAVRVQDAAAQSARLRVKTITDLMNAVLSAQAV